MGYQLWTSPITGYRRKGTRLSELRALLDSRLTVRAILEPLQSCPADADSQKMARLLSERDFDVAGVQTEQDGQVIGFVERSALTSGRVRDHAKTLTADHLISDETPLSVVLSVFKSRPRAFVLIGPVVKGIASRTDLNKPPARIYLFSLISLLEMHLAFWIRAEYQGDTWQKNLSTARLDAVNRIHAARKEAGQTSDPFDCLQMADKRDLLLLRTELCGELGLQPRKRAASRLRKAENLRNLLAHGQHSLVDGSSWEDLFDLVEWLELFVQTSDDVVEARVATAAQHGLTPLWSSA